MCHEITYIIAIYIIRRNTMSDKKIEKATPVTEEEMDDIRVTLDLDEGEVECRILSIFEAAKKDYIALLPLDEDGNDNPNGDVYLYRYYEDEEGLPSVEYIEDPEEYEAAADRFDEMMDEELFDSMD
jgi:uncharacterized protein YrzB (UPF0473 family)